MNKLSQLKTFQDACRIEGLDAKQVLPDFSTFPRKDRKSMTAHAKLVIIARAANRLANEGKEWKPDFDNHDQWKYTPYFYKEKGSSGFRFHVCGRWLSASRVGSRLCFISREVAEYVGNQFIKLYNEYFL